MERLSLVRGAQNHRICHSRDQRLALHALHHLDLDHQDPTTMAEEVIKTTMEGKTTKIQVSNLITLWCLINDAVPETTLCCLCLTSCQELNKMVADQATGRRETLHLVEEQVEAELSPEEDLVEQINLQMDKCHLEVSHHLQLSQILHLSMQITNEMPNF